MTAAVELNIAEIRMAEFAPVMDRIVADYYAASDVSGHMPPVEINWRDMLRMEDDHKTLCIGATDGFKLIGFIIYFTINHIHHRTAKMAMCDICAVLPDYRGRGIARVMMKCAEPLLKEAGCALVTHNFRTCYDVEPLFPKLGYKLIEHVYMKEL